MSNVAAAFRPSSLGRINALAGNTLLELIRQKVFYFMLLFVIVAIAAAFGASILPFADVFQVLKDASLGAMSIFSWLLVTLATAMILPKDIEDRTLYTILAKPVSRLEYLIGKLIGIFMLLLVALLLMSVFFVIALYAREQIAIANALKEYGTSADGVAAIADIKKAAFQWNLGPAILVIFTRSAVCASLTLMISCFSTSWIFTVMVSVVVFIIGHIQPVARDAWLSQSELGGNAAVAAFMRPFFAIVSIIFPDFQIYNIVDEIAVGNVVPMWMFGQAFAFGGGYVLVYALIAYLFFAFREL